MSAFNARCTGCGVELEIPSEYAGHTIDCPQCSTQFIATQRKPLEPRQVMSPRTTSMPGEQPSNRKSGLPSKRKYPALEIVRKVYAVLAYVMLLGGALFLCMQAYLFVQGRVPALNFSVTIVVTIVVVVFYFVTLKAFSEGLKLLMDIQHNTLVTARNSDR